MSPEAFEATCLSLPGVHKVVQWGGASVFKIGPKIFAISGLGRPEDGARYTFKVSPFAYDMLIEVGIARPAPYLRGAKWVRLIARDAMPDADLAAYLAEAHALVAARLTRAERARLGIASPPKPGRAMRAEGL